MGFYEIHVTVRTSDVIGFITTCESLGVKPIVIDLQNKEGCTVLHDVMTSSGHHGGWEEPLRSIVVGLESAGFDVVRRKVERNPRTLFEEDLPVIYRESHMRVFLSEIEIPKLRQFALGKAHVSRNMFKRISGGFCYMMLTVRQYGTSSEGFEYDVKKLYQQLIETGYSVNKLEIEECIYDSNLEHDKAWIG